MIAYSQADSPPFPCKGCVGSIWVARADASQPKQLTYQEGDDCNYDEPASWSPDGRELVFSRSSCINDPRLLVVSAKGGPVRELHVAGSNPAWGPTRIAFESKSGISTIAPNGSERREIAAGGSMPAWSPDGKLAYLLGRADPILAVLEGGKTSRVQLPFVSVNGLAWSADGRTLVVSGRPRGRAVPDIYTVDAGGHILERLTVDLDTSGASLRG